MIEALDLLIAGGTTDPGDLKQIIGLSSHEVMRKMTQRYSTAMLQRYVNRELKLQAAVNRRSA
jgi:hypothetical protein